MKPNGMRVLTAIAVIAMVCCAIAAQDESPLSGRADAFRFRSSADGSMQPAFAFVPNVATNGLKMPLLVSLHTWSASWKDEYPRTTLQRDCLVRGWALVHPDFRGCNDKPAACGSEMAMRDILDAIAWMKAHHPIDGDRVYVIGCSGGGHMALQMVAHYPEVFAAAFAGCPISDLVAWHAESAKETDWRHRYAVMMEKACGGAPAERLGEYRCRSPLFALEAARGLPVYISEGIHDGHAGSVPVSQSLNAFNVLANVCDRLSARDIAEIVATERIPAALGNPVPDPFYGPRNRLLFARMSGNVKVALFDGGHAGNLAAGVDFLARQQRGRHADWTLPETATATAVKEATR